MEDLKKLLESKDETLRILEDKIKKEKSSEKINLMLNEKNKILGVLKDPKANIHVQKNKKNKLKKDKNEKNENVDKKFNRLFG